MFVIREKYTDWLGNEREEDFRFNISKNELSKVQFSKNGGFDTYLKRIIDAQSQKDVMEVFERILDLSYGVVSNDGRGFVKNAEVLSDFKSTAAYDNIYMRLISDSNFAAEFVNSVFPADLMAKAKEDGNLPKELEAKTAEVSVVKK